MGSIIASKMAAEHFSIFAVDVNTTATTSNYSLWKVLTLSGEDISSFWEMFLGITIWMVISYVFVYIIVALISMIMLRNHPWMFIYAASIFGMAILGPATVGALTSASIALMFSSADKAISCWHCMILGSAQTLAVVIISFSRILATL
uniref:Transmembrane protein 170A n=1 Tax=Onchocerca volvulus TaxID=6282 RepID=A0A8R1TL66_ONCVO